MGLPRDLGRDKCLELLRSGVFGRVAIAAPDGPHIVPLNYSVVDDAIVVATSPYSQLATAGPGHRVAFEVDHVDYATHTGWSVVVRGRAELVTDPEAVRRLKETWPPRPWAEGSRNLHLRIPVSEVSGRSIGAGTDVPVRRTVGS
jgi:nitroimidazol reductase NimA-like FMN-containing flavoprotein (pyridoxamine 5'-phosphate oxidase superfamily)